MSLKSQVSRIAIWKGCRVELMKAWLNVEVPEKQKLRFKILSPLTGQFSAAEYDWFKAYEERHLRGDAEMIIFPYFFFTQLWSVEEDDL